MHASQIINGESIHSWNNKSEMEKIWKLYRIISPYFRLLGRKILKSKKLGFS